MRIGGREQPEVEGLRLKGLNCLPVSCLGYVPSILRSPNAVLCFARKVCKDYMAKKMASRSFSNAFFSPILETPDSPHLLC